MTKISSLGIGDAMASHPHIDIKKRWFGIEEDVFYTPTGKKINYHEMYVKGKSCAIIDNLMHSESAEEIDDLLKSRTKLETSSNGNERLEVCLSDDQNFAAIQTYRYEGYIYRKLNDVRIFEGETAQKVAELLNLNFIH